MQRVRTAVIGDSEKIFGWRNHKKIREYMYNRIEISPDEHTHWFEKSLEDRSRHLLVFEQENEALGFINIGVTSAGNIAEWGFYAAPTAPPGTGSKLANAALHYAFYQINLHKICGQVLAYNERSIKLHLKCGFSEEGILRDQHFDGERYHDVVCFGLLAREWKAKH